jgi:acetylornithine deacetylase
MNSNQYQPDPLQLLQQLIATPSFSKTEHKTAAILENFFTTQGIQTNRLANNIWIKNKFSDPAKPTILLNAHHDTVQPNQAYTRDPFNPEISDGKLFGLGSNDAGASLVSLIAVFLNFYKEKNLKYNLILALSAEEEISGKNGIELLLPELGPIDLGIVGEPTLMQMAVAEKGLLVIDCTASGIPGHAARNEGENAIYNALPDLEWFRSYQFEKISNLLGPVKMNVTILNAGTQHNIVPHTCSFTVDVRTTDSYSNAEVFAIIQKHVRCKLIPRSMRLHPSAISNDHPIVQAGLAMGLQTYGSPTMSDQALMPFATIKIGPGDSARSHTADEFIFTEEILNGIDVYIQLLKNLL